MKRIILMTMAIAMLGDIMAQNQFRITQTLPDTINHIVVSPGWNVVIKPGAATSISILTPCEAFYDQDNEPEVCRIEGRELTLLPNRDMPRSTTLEINLSRPLRQLDVEEGASVETGCLQFGYRKAYIYIDSNATVRGTSWHASGDLDVDVRGTLTLDTIHSDALLKLRRDIGSTVVCPVLQSQGTRVRSDVRSFGTSYTSDSTRNLSVKQTNRVWTRYINGLSLSFGLSAPVPLYMNNKYESPYNRAENYRLTMYLDILNSQRIARNLTFRPGAIFEVDWSRLLNSVAYDGNGLALSTPATGSLPHQMLLANSIGLRLQFTYSFGKGNDRGFKPYRINIGMNAMRNLSSSLVTRTMGSDNRWHRDKERVDVYNPWQLRAFLNLSGGPLTGCILGFTYDLLPTFRSGIGANNIHTFGISIGF